MKSDRRVNATIDGSTPRCRTLLLLEHTYSPAGCQSSSTWVGRCVGQVLLHWAAGMAHTARVAAPAINDRRFCLTATEPRFLADERIADADDRTNGGIGEEEYWVLLHINMSC